LTKDIRELKTSSACGWTSNNSQYCCSSS